MSEMLTEMVPGQEDSSDLELLQVRGGMSLSCGSSGPGDPAVRQEQGPGDYCGKGPSPYKACPQPHASFLGPVRSQDQALFFIFLCDIFFPRL